MITPKKLPRDSNERAFQIGKLLTEGEPSSESTPKNRHAVALGRLGGKKGGKVRASRLSPEARRESAKKAARARWSGTK
jgi:hypothetical protein